MDQKLFFFAFKVYKVLLQVRTNLVNIDKALVYFRI